MSSTAASGFVFLLLSVQVIQSQDGWGVTYISTEVCAVKGSRVGITCSYTYPSGIQDRDIRNRFWFTKEKDGEPVDLMTDSEYSGRVLNGCDEKSCTLIITDLRESDSADYKFMITTNQPEDKYTGSPGVTLSVTDPGVQVKVSRSGSNRVNLKCLSRYVLPDDPSYIWYRNGKKIWTESSSISVSFDSSNRYFCAVRGPENLCSPPVYGPKLPSVSVSPSDEIVEGSSVTLTCSSDANPAAKYTWNKEKQPPLSEEPQLVFSSIQSSDSGLYYCKAENQLKRKRSKVISIDVKYAPKLPSVSVSPSAEIVEGSSVNLTCSSDANPAANYTWYKEDEDSPKASGQIFIITDFTAEHSGKYSCEAQNTRGRRNSTFYLSVAADTTMIIQTIRWTLLVVVLISLLLVYLWMRIQSRKKKALISTTEPHEPIEAVELDLYPVYDDIAVQPEDTEEQEDQLDLDPVYDDIAAQPEDTEEQEDQV